MVGPKDGAAHAAATGQARGRRPAWPTAIALGAAACGIGFACGGTTGREDLPVSQSSPPATADGGIDATLPSLLVGELDSGEFDTAIRYADRALPDVSVPPEAGPLSESGSRYPWPDCPPFIPVNHPGHPTPIAHASNELPADYSDASDTGSAIAADGSACATYGWILSPADDECINSGTGGQAVAPQFPPCSWCLQAGNVAQGTKEGASRYDVCLQLYQCMVKTGCGLQGGAACLCGTEGSLACSKETTPPGPCAAEELAALEAIPGDSLVTILESYTDNAPSYGGYCGSQLNLVYNEGVVFECYPSDDGGADD